MEPAGAPVTMISVGSGDCIFFDANQLQADKQAKITSTKTLKRCSPLRREDDTVSRSAAVGIPIEDAAAEMIGCRFLTHQARTQLLWPGRIGSPVIVKFQIPLNLLRTQSWRAPPSRRAEGASWRGE